jgi:hypothetical protein
MPNRNAGHNVDPGFDPEEIERADPLGEEIFAEAGFEDAPEGGPDFSAPALEDDGDRRPGRLPQKVAGIPEPLQHQVNSPSADRPDSDGIVIRERGGAGKGDPAVGGTRPE